MDEFKGGNFSHGPRGVGNTYNSEIQAYSRNLREVCIFFSRCKNLGTDYLIRTVGDSKNESEPYAIVLSRQKGASVSAEEEREVAQVYRSRRDSSLFFVTLGAQSGSQQKGKRLTLTRRVDGEVRPFSIVVSEADENEAGRLAAGDESNRASEKRPLLKIRDRLFAHGGKMYIISNVPESKPTHHFMMGPKYISRLDSLPVEDPSDVELQTRSRAERRMRGRHAGEILGTGITGRGHEVKIEDEDLEDIGLPLAVSSFLLNTTAHSYQKNKLTR